MDRDSIDEKTIHERRGLERSEAHQRLHTIHDREPTELAHSHEIASALLEAIIAEVEILLSIAKLEGDAVFLYLTETCCRRSPRCGFHDVGDASFSRSVAGHQGRDRAGRAGLRGEGTAAFQLRHDLRTTCRDGSFAAECRHVFVDRLTVKSRECQR